MPEIPVQCDLGPEIPSFLSSKNSLKNKTRATPLPVAGVSESDRRLDAR